VLPARDGDDDAVDEPLVTRDELTQTTWLFSISGQRRADQKGR
jgi:hypothetical protein